MMFDNGTAKVKLSDNDNRVSGDDIYSRAVVYHINTDDMTIEQVFEYGKERGPEWYSDWISGVISWMAQKTSSGSQPVPTSMMKKTTAMITIRPT